MKKKRKLKKKNIIILIIIIILLVIFCISLTNIINWKKDNDDNLKIQEDLNQYIKEEPKEDEEYKIDFKALKEQNSDVVAYLEVPNTNIKYVVVKGKDNDYYLKHNFNKEYNNAGWIFADYRNKFNFTDYNIIIYGHNTRDGSMFGTLKNVLNEDWFSNKDNHEIVLVTENRINKYQVFSVYEDKASDYPITTEFKNDNEYLKFLKTIKKKSKYDFNVDVSEEKSILTLSTCATNNQNRVTLHAINIK
ncbi:MAG: class B sortase [Bacilli bacterium]|nr:class B sortase [Bacilli bacterium]